jgi:type I restriction enzyme S subunit
MEAIKPTIGYKQTEIGIIPEEWEVVRLGDVFDMQQGKAMSPKSRLGIFPQPFLRTVNVLWGHVDLSTLDYMDFTDEEITKLCLQPGDLLVCEGGEIGRTAMWRGEIKVCGYQNHIHRLRKQREDIWSEFYMYWLQAAFLILGLYAGEEIRTTIPNLSGGRLKSFLVPKPPLEEQQKIARVLSTIQRAIEQQDKIIEATRKFKKSLLHKLFTEGLNGEEQKETEIGRVPKSWDVVRLGDAVDFTKKPRTLNLSEFREIPFIPMEMIPIEKLYINDYLIKSSNEITSGVYCEKGNILLAKITPSFENGKQGIVENIPYDFAFATTEVYPLKPRNNLDKLFLFYFLIKSDIREAIAGKMQGTTGRKRVPKEAVENTLIPFPPLPEQQQIAHILSTVDKKIEIEERRKTTLKELFKTMLHKLMSGEIRLKDREMEKREE